MILLSELLDAEIAVRDEGESMVSLRGAPGILVDESRSEIASRSEHFCFVRASLRRKLVEAASLLPEGFLLLVKEGYRPAARQRASFEAALAKYAARFPGLDGKGLLAEVSRYVAPPEVAGHPTGGAVDLTLFRGGREVFMGTRFNEEPAETDGLTCLDASGLPEEPRAARAVLRRVLEGVGLVNYPPEWWHWSYGDKYWAHAAGRDALYGPVEEESLGAAPGRHDYSRKVQ